MKNKKISGIHTLQLSSALVRGGHHVGSLLLIYKEVTRDNQKAWMQKLNTETRRMEHNTYMSI
ncbi:hypothetical protein COU75_00015 [Candidatus Peregrinibacteria bacterium CG10_big_fil_rev_8_21_14_0_10_42_8]|nr:MAG: hypothetical protein COU75_00015 [Candidatus Peregrinibacteria bacterium CG10_big_fil_rev_8_21_14_0_10_42_8]